MEYQNVEVTIESATSQLLGAGLSLRAATNIFQRAYLTRALKQMKTRGKAARLVEVHRNTFGRILPNTSWGKKRGR